MEQVVELLQTVVARLDTLIELQQAKNNKKGKGVPSDAKSLPVTDLDVIHNELLHLISPHKKIAPSFMSSNEVRAYLKEKTGTEFGVKAIAQTLAALGLSSTVRSIEGKSKRGYFIYLSEITVDTL